MYLKIQCLIYLDQSIVPNRFLKVSAIAYMRKEQRLEETVLNPTVGVAVKKPDVKRLTSDCFKYNIEVFRGVGGHSSDITPQRFCSLMYFPPLYTRCQYVIVSTNLGCFYQGFVPD